MCFFVKNWWREEDSNLRSTRRQIYSLLGLTAPQSLQFDDSYFCSRMILSQPIIKLSKFNKEIILKDLNKENFDLFLLRSIDSTNEECKRISIKKKFLVVSANKQTSGKGRHGRNWLTPEGNIALSISYEAKSDGPPISLITSIIVTNALSKSLNEENIKIKWPNDIVFRRKKVAGILVEKEKGSDLSKIIVGIGINLELSEEKESWWGDFSEFKLKNLRDEIINKILKGFEDYLERGVDSWLETWESKCMHLNKKIVFIKEEKEIEGVCKGINSQGHIKLDFNNKIQEFESGEISIKGVYDY